jgi:lysine decarboxylase
VPTIKKPTVSSDEINTLPTPLTQETVLSRRRRHCSQKNQHITDEFTSEKSTLNAAIGRHIEKERVSFHTPGHKGRLRFEGLGDYVSLDLTELPGLDDLSNPKGVLQDLEERAAAVWGARSSILSVNGASGGLIAALITLARRGSHILVPRNCHRSIVNGLVLTGLEPLWFDPVWEEDWGIWGGVTGEIISSALRSCSSDKLAGVVIVSPTYSGAVSELRQIAQICHQFNVPLVVDEAHGAHCLLPETKERSALTWGADLVVHSLHKTIGALTQTGVIHISNEGADRFALNKEDLRASLNLLQSTSPSYVLLSSIDERISAMESGHCFAELEKLERLGQRLRQSIQQLKRIKIYEPAMAALNSDVLLGCEDVEGLYDFLKERGVYAEAILGSGLLLLLGTGSSEEDLNFLVQALNEFDQSQRHPAARAELNKRPEPIEQALSPRQAFNKGSKNLPAEEAIGAVAAECLAPCPPGWPILVPGQRIKASDLRGHNMPTVKVIVQPF